MAVGDPHLVRRIEGGRAEPGPDQRGCGPGARPPGGRAGEPDAAGRTRAPRTTRRVARGPDARQRVRPDDAGRRAAKPRRASRRAPVPHPLVLPLEPEGNACHATPAAVHRPERPGTDPGRPTPGLQEFPGHRARHRDRRSGARRAHARAPALGRARRRHGRVDGTQDRVQRHVSAVGHRQARARNRDPEDVAPLLRRPDLRGRAHVPGHDRVGGNLASEPVPLRRGVGGLQ